MGAYAHHNTTRTMSDNPSPWSEDEVARIETALSPERFARYLAIASSKSDALQYYAWNTALSSAFAGPLQCLEVGLRNAVDGRLASTRGASWFHNPSVLRSRDLVLAQEARDRVLQTGKALSPGRVVAELSFGFWVGMFANAYDATIWRTDLYRIFSPRPQRRDLHDDLDRLRTLRNRIAHHEPIFQRSLIDDYKRIGSVLRALSPELCDWMEFHSRVLDVIADGPMATARF